MRLLAPPAVAGALAATLLLSGCPSEPRQPTGGGSRALATTREGASNPGPSPAPPAKAATLGRPTLGRPTVGRPTLGRPMLRSSLWRFDRIADGALPVGMRGVVGRWGVAQGASSPSPGDKRRRAPGKVLVQSAKSRSSIFNVLLVASARERDVALTVRLRARGGRIDQGGGLVWRAADASNYYVARYNPLEENFRLYTVRGGRRVMLAGATVRIDRRLWHVMRVTMRGDHIRCYLDGKLTIEKRDTTFATTGMIGLWTKADAVTEFDDLAVRNLQP